jgi:hypothetical protein
MAKRNECLVLLMEDIDHIVRNVVFECLWQLMISSKSFSKYVAFSYCHANVIDIMGTTTITINIRGGFTKTHVKFIKKRLFFMAGIFFCEGQNKL